MNPTGENGDIISEYDWSAKYARTNTREAYKTEIVPSENIQVTTTDRSGCYDINIKIPKNANNFTVADMPDFTTVTTPTVRNGYIQIQAHSPIDKITIHGWRYTSNTNSFSFKDLFYSRPR